MNNFERRPYVLGLDLGPNSIGWALIEQKKEHPHCLRASGVRIFKEGLEDLQVDGKGKSRNVQRREARARRRLTERRTRRTHNLAVALQRCGLLPEGDLAEPEQRYVFFMELDKNLESPYFLRKRALDEKLTPHEFGRALYHLSQHRGFLSNRKTPPKKDAEEKGMKKEISHLQKSIGEAGCRTLGEYFSKIYSKERIRGHYTSRKMYKDEYNAIWDKQSRYHKSLLNDKLRKKIHGLIFYQRPLKSQSRFVGECELEKGQKRAPWALLSAQRYRYLATLDNLSIDGLSGEPDRGLEENERKVLIDKLETSAEVSFAAMRKLLSLPKGAKFNLERGGEKKMLGNRTIAGLMKILGVERWNSLSEQERMKLVADCHFIDNDEALKKRGVKKWNLDETMAAGLSQLKLEPGYCRFSRKALQKLLPELEKGNALQTAIKECYPELWQRKGQPVEQLPPVQSDAMPTLRNPIVERTLTETRRVVNAIIQRYGKPDYIRIELGRDLRQSAEDRKNTWKRNRANEDERKRAAEIIVKDADIAEPKRDDILKVILAEECNWECPYTGNTIKINSLFGEYPQFDIEHIIPFDRSLDDSYMNKTLCDAKENREIKHKRTPYEAYNGTGKWEEILARVEKFKGGAAYAKLRRFKMEPKDVETLLADFTSRQLNDMRWASKWAKKYLGLLYGGVNDDGIDAAGKRRVQAVSGQVTAFLRNEWELNRILGDGPGKSRDDHRHHAVDAVVIALTEPGVVKALNDAAKSAGVVGRRLFDKIQPPWDGFLEETRATINNIIVSHRVSCPVSGALHKETFYGKLRKDDKGKTYVHSRVRLDNLKENEIKDILDPAIRLIIQEKLKETGESDPQKAFKDPKNHPFLQSKDGKKNIPIHKVRIRENISESFLIDPIRRVKSDRIHHMAIFETHDKRGNIKWDCEVVSMFEAYKRLKDGKSIIRYDMEDGKKFVFSISCGEIIEIDAVDNKSRGLYILRTVPESRQIYFTPINDARKEKEIGKVGLTAPPESLRKRNCRKMVVAPLGELRYAYAK